MGLFFLKTETLLFPVSETRYTIPGPFFHFFNDSKLHFAPCRC